MWFCFCIKFFFSKLVILCKDYNYVFVLFCFLMISKVLCNGLGFRVDIV
jgi:hypothetical protein